MLTPVIIGFGINYFALGAFLAAVILTGQLMAVFLSNAGGAWDNAKKYIEDGHEGGKGSEAHKAAVIGDTIGDPFKDTAGPALNPLIKVMNLVSLLILPAVIALRIQRHPVRDRRGLPARADRRDPVQQAQGHRHGRTHRRGPRGQGRRVAPPHERGRVPTKLGPGRAANRRMLSRLVEWAASALESAGLLGLFLVLVAENLFPPIPSEAVLPLAGYLVSTGEFTFVAAWLAATAGALVGALILYALGRWGGRPLIYRFHWLLRIKPRGPGPGGPLVRRARRRAHRGRPPHPAGAVGGVGAGRHGRDADLALRAAHARSAPGVWNAALIGGGMALGDQYERLADRLDALTWPLLGLGMVLIAAYVVLTLRRRRRAPAA